MTGNRDFEKIAFSLLSIFKEYNANEKKDLRWKDI